MATGRKNKKLAEKRFHELMLEVQANPSPESEIPTVVSIIESFLTHFKRHYETRSFEERKRILQRFAEAHGYRMVAECRPFHLTQWLNANPQWESDWTLNTVVSVVKRPFEWACNEGLIENNPFRYVTRSPGQPRRPITESEFQALLRGAPGHRGLRFRQVLIFSWFTGSRPGELAVLKWTDLDLETGMIVLVRHKTVKKVRRPRLISLVPAVVKLLIHLRKHSESEFVFVNERGNPWNRCSLSSRIQRCRQRERIPDDAKLYGVRHHFGTKAIVRGVDIKTLAQLMGHASTGMTEHYVHLVGERGHLVRSMRRATSDRPDAAAS